MHYAISSRGGCATSALSMCARGNLRTQNNAASKNEWFACLQPERLLLYRAEASPDTMWRAHYSLLSRDAQGLCAESGCRPRIPRANGRAPCAACRARGLAFRQAKASRKKVYPSDEGTIKRV